MEAYFNSRSRIARLCIMFDIDRHRRRHLAHAAPSRARTSQGRGADEGAGLIDVIRSCSAGRCGDAARIAMLHQSGMRRRADHKALGVPRTLMMKARRQRMAKAKEGSDADDEEVLCSAS